MNYAAYGENVFIPDVWVNKYNAEYLLGAVRNTVELHFSSVEILESFPLQVARINLSPAGYLWVTTLPDGRTMYELLDYEDYLTRRLAYQQQQEIPQDNDLDSIAESEDSGVVSMFSQLEDDLDSLAESEDSDVESDDDDLDSGSEQQEIIPVEDDVEFVQEIIQVDDDDDVELIQENIQVDDVELMVDHPMDHDDDVELEEPLDLRVQARKEEAEMIDSYQPSRLFGFVELKPRVFIPGAWTTQHSRATLEEITENAIADWHVNHGVTAISMEPVGWMWIVRGEYWFLHTSLYQLATGVLQPELANGMHIWSMLCR